MKYTEEETKIFKEARNMVTKAAQVRSRSAILIVNNEPEANKGKKKTKSFAKPQPFRGSIRETFTGSARNGFNIQK